MGTYREKLHKEGVTEETLDNLDKDFREQFAEMIDDYDIEVSPDEEQEVFDLGVEVLFETVYEFGSSQEISKSTVEYAEEVANDTGQAERYNIFFVCGRAAGEYPNTRLAEVSRQLRVKSF